MTSTNINKIVQSNINLKPWMLSKKTNQIVNTCIQKIYKQMPASFNKSPKIAKVSTPRTENKGPLRTFKSQERDVTLTTIKPTNAALKRSSTKLKPQNNSLLQSLKASNKNNQQMAAKLTGTNLLPNKRLLKSPNYKIYKSRRFGSSASSSRSSLFRRYDERRRQRQSFPTPINYLIRSFHTSQLEPTYARYLMPVRNQQLEGNLGSIPDAIKISTNIQNDLMHIDAAMRCKVAKKSNVKLIERNRLDVWNHPPSLSRFRINSPKDSPIKNVQTSLERSMKRARPLPEHREYTRINMQRMAPMKHPKPPNELFTAQHDRKKTELHEKHRRNRMKKLGLIETPSTPETETEEGLGGADSIRLDQSPTDPKRRTKKVVKHISKSSPSLCNQLEAKTSSKQQTNKERKSNTLINTKMENSIPLNPIEKPMKTITLPSQDLSSSSSTALPMTSPIAAVRAQLPTRSNKYPTYRYNRADFFSTKKY